MTDLNLFELLFEYFSKKFLNLANSFRQETGPKEALITLPDILDRTFCQCFF